MWQGRGTRGFVLIELLVVILLIALAAGVYFAWYSPRRAKALKEAVESGNPTQVPVEPQSVLGQALQKGESVNCMNNLSQLRQAIQMYVADNGTYPPNLEALQLPGMTTCPVTGQPYQYDPNSGTVRCPAHPKY
ncbi:MAG: prepilin-type N-terminal cleavage/methylation domain-containing protein [Armatimonadetes bacterium]|nr:prepilin-type N-terminal cleavage/methylation domain-containing protein [Armatimonadota bacterium]